MNNRFTKTQKIIVGFWAVEMVGLMIYVPYGEFYIGENYFTPLKDIVKFDWLGAEVEPANRRIILINYTLLAYELIVWTVVTLGVVFAFRGE